MEYPLLCGNVMSNGLTFLPVLNLWNILHLLLCFYNRQTRFFLNIFLINMYIFFYQYFTSIAFLKEWNSFFSILTLLNLNCSIMFFILFLENNYFFYRKRKVGFFTLLNFFVYSLFDVDIFRTLYTHTHTHTHTHIHTHTNTQTHKYIYIYKIFLQLLLTNKGKVKIYIYTFIPHMHRQMRDRQIDR